MRGDARGIGHGDVRLIAAGLLALAGGAAAASAETRSYTLTDFDRIRMAGPYEVTLRIGPAVSARAEGSAAAIDRARLDVQGGTLTVALDRTRADAAGEGAGKLRIVLTAPTLRGVLMTGSGSLAIDRPKAPAFTASVAGAGALRIDGLATDRLVLSLAGAGDVTVSGKAALATLSVQGEGRIAGEALTVTDAGVTLAGAGAITVTGARTAKVTATGGGSVTVLGTPTCTVRNEGTGEVRCGTGR